MESADSKTWLIKKNEGIACNSRVPCKEMLESSIKKLNEISNNDAIQTVAGILIPALKNIKSALPFYRDYDAYSGLVDDALSAIQTKNFSNIPASVSDALKSMYGNYNTLKISRHINLSGYIRYLNNLKTSIDKLIFALKNSNKFSINDLLGDYNRIVYSSAFRRLQHKAQVFSLEKYDYVRTRLTHTIEVSSIAADLGNICAQKLYNDSVYSGTYKKTMQFEFEKICACAALLHDIGNPPFGHLGERAIRNYFKENWDNLKVLNPANDALVDLSEIPHDSNYEQMKNDFLCFDGNAQGLRVATKLPMYKPDHSSELSASILGAAIKYPHNSTSNYSKEKQKLGYYYSEKDRIDELSVLGVYCEGIRNPFAFLVEAADDISYVTSDFDDIVKKGILTYEDFKINLNKIRANKADKELLNFKNNFLKFYKENEKVQDMIPPFELTIQRMTNDLRIELIKTVAKVFTENTKAVNSNKYLFNMGIQTAVEKYSSLIENSNLDKLVEWIKDIFNKYVYPNKAIIATELSGYSIIYNLLDAFVKSVLSLDFTLKGNKFAFQNDNSDKVAKQKRIFNLISNNFVGLFKNETKDIADKNSFEHIYYRLRLVVDYISGMTDTYAKEVYQTINGIN